MRYGAETSGKCIMSKTDINRNNEIISLYISGMSGSDLADRYGVTRQAISYVLTSSCDYEKIKKLHDRNRFISEKEKNKELIKNEKHHNIVNMYSEGQTIKEIAIKFKLSVGQITQILKYNSYFPPIHIPKTKIYSDEIIKLYLSGATASQICDKIGISKQTLMNFLREKRKQKTINIVSKKQPHSITLNLIKDLIKQKNSIEEISKQLKLSPEKIEKMIDYIKNKKSTKNYLVRYLNCCINKLSYGI